MKVYNPKESKKSMEHRDRVEKRRFTSPSAYSSYPPLKRQKLLPSPEAPAGGLHPTPSLSTIPIDLALGILLNNRVVTTSESKGDVKSRVTYPPDFLAAARSVLRGTQLYQFRMSRTGTLTSGSSTIALTISTDLSQYNEGSALTALFEECRLWSTQIQIISQVSSTATQFQYILAFNPIYTTATPMFAECGRLPGSILRSTNDTTGMSHTQHGHVGPRIYGLTSDEGTAPVVVNSGGNGTWQLVNTTAVNPASSITYFSYNIISVMKLRNRS
jgi:hypothetical protein